MTVVGIQLYGKVTSIFKEHKDAQGNITRKAGPYDYFLGQGVTFVYQMLLI